jgi:hypothetical protein
MEWANRSWVNAFSRPYQSLVLLDHLRTMPKLVRPLVGLVGRKAIKNRAKLGWHVRPWTFYG